MIHSLDSSCNYLGWSQVLYKRMNSCLIDSEAAHLTFPFDSPKFGQRISPGAPTMWRKRHPSSSNRPNFCRRSASASDCLWWSVKWVLCTSDWPVLITLSKKTKNIHSMRHEELWAVSVQAKQIKIIAPLCIFYVPHSSHVTWFRLWPMTKKSTVGDGLRAESWELWEVRGESDSWKES